MTFRITKNNSTNFAYKGHGWSIYKPSTGSQDSKALNQGLLILESAVSKHSKEMFLRIDFHPAEYNSNNELIKSYLSKATNELEKKYGCKVSYFCAREQDSSEREHYHVVFFLSAHKVKYPDGIQKYLSSSWREFSKGSTRFVERPFYIMKRGDKSTFDEAIYRLSYLTKNHSKQKNGKAKSYIFSQISKREREELKSRLNLLVDPEITRLRNLKFLVNFPKCKKRNLANKPPAKKLEKLAKSPWNRAQKAKRILLIDDVNNQIQHHLSALFSLFELAESILPDDYVP